MFPGQRTSRRTQNLEAMSMSVDAGDDGFDEYGVPTKTRTRGSAPAAKQKGFFGRMRRGSSSNLSAAGAGDGMDSDDDDDGAYANVPGFQVMNGPPDASRSSGGPYGGSLGPAGAQTTPQGLDTMRGQPPLRSSAPSLNGVAPAPAPPPPQSEISMDQISSLRDRHRYPAIDDDPQKGRAMSLNSMSTYDTTPIIPTLGGPSAFAAVGPHSKGSQQDKYRQRMIESRRALMSSETGIPLTGNVKLPDPIGNGMPAMAAPRSMSMTSMQSQLGPGRGPPGSDRSNTMSGQMIPPQLMHSPLVPGGGSPQPYMRASHPGLPHAGPPPLHPGMRQGLGVQMGPYGGLPQGNLPHGGPMMMQRGPPHLQGPQQTMYPPNQGPYGPVMPGAGFQQQPGYQPQYLHPNQQYQDGSAMAPPLATPQLDGPMRNSVSPMRSDMSHLQFPRGSQPPQIGLQREANESNEFDFGPTGDASARDGRSSVSDSQSQSNIEAYDEQISSLTEDVRVLTIELSESARRELDLPRKEGPATDEDSQNGETEKPATPRERAEALAKAHAELALERAKRQAAEKAAMGNPTIDAEEKLAEIEYRHAETLHLLSARTEQYEALKKRFASLEQDFTERKEETEGIVMKAKESKLAENLYEQDQHLKHQLTVLETENKRLREELDNYDMRGPLGSRITALEDQRSALQEALRAMRERKDAEINALNHRIESLNLAQQRVASSGSSLMKSMGTRAVSGSSMLGSKDPSPAPGPLMTSAISAPGPNDSQLSLPRMRHSSLSRPASPLRLGLEYSH